MTDYTRAQCRSAASNIAENACCAGLDAGLATAALIAFGDSLPDDSKPKAKPEPEPAADDRPTRPASRAVKTGKHR